VGNGIAPQRARATTILDMMENCIIHEKVPTRAQENRGSAKEAPNSEERTSKKGKNIGNERNFGEAAKMKTKKKRTNGSARLRKS
jgi:hypothetical protein